ncbi:unnamed protein product [Protopolystoma xenopodis]|uniref:Uncharacterized protein n=1 Tax=Protopolystoma xenopodis TaxID=117903 RepID=A0A3S4ZK45_9PLAT|nr:unnamed protein product [Protopolystoma xenopodis]
MSRGAFDVFLPSPTQPRNNSTRYRVTFVGRNNILSSAESASCCVSLIPSKTSNHCQPERRNCGSTDEDCLK